MIEPTPGISKASAELEVASENLKKAKRYAQKRCKHGDGYATFDSNTGHWDSGDDSYWVDLYCPRCLYCTTMPQEEYRRLINIGRIERWKEKR